MNSGDRIHGFVVKDIRDIKCLNIQVIQLEHTRTGANHLHISAEDSNNCFALTFKTIPTDSSGIAHVLEHMLLCGSKKYPSDSQFTRVMSSGFKTFINAITTATWTMYVFASQNEKGFYQLADMYLDAAFYPLLKESDFLRQCCRVERDTSGNSGVNFKYNGIVYNEMLGVFSNPSSLMYQKLFESLFPSLPYRHSFGGNPGEIPHLSQKTLLAFHARFYQPRNAYTYTYGNFPLERHLKFLNDRLLQAATRGESEAVIALGEEHRYESPKTFHFPYPAQTQKAAHSVAIAWLTCSIRNPREFLPMKILSNILLGHDGAPLRRALIESNVGKRQLAFSGLIGDTSEAIFATGLDSCDTGNIDNVEKIVLSTLNEVMGSGISRTQIESAIHQYELKTRSIPIDQYPYGLNLLSRFINVWLIKGNPAELLDFEENLVQLKKTCFSAGYFEALMSRWFLANPHRVKVIMSPDVQMTQRESAEIQNSLATFTKAKLPEVPLLNNANKILRSMAGIDALSTISLNDFTKVSVTPLKKIERSNIAGSGVHYYTCHANGVIHNFNFFKLGKTPELIPFIGLLLTKSGFQNLSHAAAADLINRYTGGVSARPLTLTNIREPENSNTFLIVSSKALNENVCKLVEILTDLLTTPNFPDIKRVITILNQNIRQKELDLSMNPQAYVAFLASRHFKGCLHDTNTLLGIGQLQKLKEIRNLLQSNPESLIRSLCALKNETFTKTYLTTAVVGENVALNQFKESYPQMVSAFQNAKGIVLPSDTIFSQALPVLKREIWLMPTTVSYTAKAIKVPNISDPVSGKLRVMTAFLSEYVLHPEIREKGGAYGGIARYSAEHGVLYFISIRDPNVKHTLSVFDSIHELAAKISLEQRDVDNLILKCLGELDFPRSPSGAVRQDMCNYLSGITPELSDAYRDAISKCTYTDIVECAKQYLQGDSSLAVITSEEICCKLSLNSFDTYTL